MIVLGEHDLPDCRLLVVVLFGPLRQQNKPTIVLKVDQNSEGRAYSISGPLGRQPDRVSIPPRRKNGARQRLVLEIKEQHAGVMAVHASGLQALATCLWPVSQAGGAQTNKHTRKRNGTFPSV